jgi:hypothetical protein
MPWMRLTGLAAGHRVHAYRDREDERIILFRRDLGAVSAGTQVGPARYIDLAAVADPGKGLMDRGAPGAGGVPPLPGQSWRCRSDLGLGGQARLAGPALAGSQAEPEPAAQRADADGSFGSGWFRRVSAADEHLAAYLVQSAEQVPEGLVLVQFYDGVAGHLCRVRAT